MKQKLLKTWLAMLCLLVLGGGNAWATDVTFNPASDKTFPKEGITLSVTDGVLTNGTDYRVYKSQTMTISSTVGNITNITLTYSSASYDGGGWAASYQPNATSWTSPTANGEQARITKLIVTVSSGGGVPTLYTVTLGDNSEKLTQTTEGGNVTLPSREGNSTYTFVGWSTTNNTEETTTKPTIISAGNYKPTANEKLFPVYKRDEGSEGYILSETVSGTTYYMKHDCSATTTKAEAEAFQWDDGYLTYSQNNNTYYISHQTSGSTTLVNNGTKPGAEKKWTITDNTTNKTVKFNSKAQTTRYLGYSSGFKAYAASHTLNYESAGTTYYISSLPSEKQTPELSFSPAVYNYTMGEEFTTPSLNNPENVLVTYSASNVTPANCIEVAEDGTVTINAAGSANITASYDGSESDTYNSNSASYQLVVAAPVQKYTISYATTENGTIVVKNGDTPLTEGAEVAEGTKLTIECTPTDADNYKFRNWQYKVGDDSWTTKYSATQDFDMPAGNTQFRANFDEIQTFTVAFSVNGVTVQSDNLKEGAEVTIPENPADINDKKFTGWIETPTVEGATPAYVTPSATATKTVTYYAVFATVEGEGNPNVLTSVAGPITSGDYYLVDTYDGVDAKNNTAPKYWAVNGGLSGSYGATGGFVAMDISEKVVEADGKLASIDLTGIPAANWPSLYTITVDENGVSLSRRVSETVTETYYCTGANVNADMTLTETDNYIWNRIVEGTDDNEGRYSIEVDHGTGKRCLLFYEHTSTPNQNRTFKNQYCTNRGAGGAQNVASFGSGYFYFLQAGEANYSDFTTTPTPVTKYAVTILDEDIENGKVTADPATAAEGETVTLTITPDDGYTLVQLMVTNLETYDEIEVEDNEFVMPAADVEVFAYFQPASSETYTLSELAEADIEPYSLVSVSFDNEIIDIQMDEEEGGYIALKDGDNTFVLQTNYPCDADWEIGGTLTGTWENVFYAEQDGIFILMNTSDDPWADLEYTLTLALDENAASIDEIYNIYDEVTVTRTLKAGIWNTLCLPFSMTADEITANFGEGAVVKELSGLTVDGEGNFKINFSTATIIEEATPYLVKVENAVSEINVTDKEVLIDPTKDDQAATVDDGSDNCVTFHGNYGKTTIEKSENNYVLSSNKFYFVNSVVTNKGFRGWFETFSMSAGVKALTLSFEDNTTAIKNVTIEGLDDDAVFDLTGRKVAKAQKGIYIKNNRKFLAK